MKINFTRIVPNQRKPNWSGVAVAISSSNKNKSLRLRIYVEADTLKKIGLKHKDGCNCSYGHDDRNIYVKIEPGDDFTVMKHSQKGYGPSLPLGEGLPQFNCKIKQAVYTVKDGSIILTIPALVPPSSAKNKTDNRHLTEEQKNYMLYAGSHPNNNVKVKREPGT